jgi:tetrahydromethanopterin S-methyltransferase subunit B
LFGVVGPERVYGTNGLYKNLMFAFLVGAGLTVIAWAVKRKWPNRITKCMFPLFGLRRY